MAAVRFLAAVPVLFAMFFLPAGTFSYWGGLGIPGHHLYPHDARLNLFV